MSEVIGHGPLLLGLLLNNQNNNNPNPKYEGVIPATVVVHEQIAEADYLRDLTLESHDNNDKNTAISGTVGVHDQVTEVDYSHGKANGSIEVGVIKLRGESQPPQVLSQAQCESYNKNGYLILPDALTADQAAELLEDARDVMKRISEGGEGIIRHDVSGSEAKKPLPVGRILATFEPQDTTAFNPFERRISRLGCGIHQKLPAFRKLTLSALNRSIAESLNYSNARITQSQLIAKLAGIGGEIVPHQDGCVSFTNPPSALTFWYALEDATLENGCLCVAEGSHLTEPLRQRLIKSDDGLPEFVKLEAPLWAQGAHRAEVEVGQQTEYEYQALEVKKGTLVLFHGNLIHKSGTNKSDKNRIAYTFSIIEGDVECPDDSYMKPVAGDYESL